MRNRPLLVSCVVTCMFFASSSCNLPSLAIVLRPQAGSSRFSPIISLHHARPRSKTYHRRRLSFSKQKPIASSLW
jgi:hypothetical protein